MSRPTPARAAVLAGLAAAAAALAGCGKTGELQRPKPLFGHPAANAGAPAGPARAGQEDPTRPVNTIDPRDIYNNPAPPRTQQIPGQAPDPTAPGPRGSLPDPYVNPR